MIRSCNWILASSRTQMRPTWTSWNANRIFVTGNGVFWGEKAYRLTLLPSQCFGKVVGMLANSVGEVEDSLLSLVLWDFGLGLESFCCSRHCAVDILWCRDWDLRVGLSSGRINAMSHFLRAGQLSIDDV